MELESEKKLKDGYEKLTKKYESVENPDSKLSEEIKKNNVVIERLTTDNGKKAYEYKQKEEALEKKFNEANEKNGKLEEELKNLKNQNDINLRNITSLESAKKQEAEDFNAALTKKDKTIAELSLKSSNLNVDKRQLNEKIANLEAEIARLNAVIDKRNEEKEALQFKIDDWEMEYNSKVDELEAQYRSQINVLEQYLHESNNKITQLENSLEEKRRSETKNNQAIRSFKHDLCHSNNEKANLQRENDELKTGVESLFERISTLEKEMHLQMKQRTRETDSLNISLNESSEKIKNLELELASTSNLKFVYLEEVFEGYKRGNNLKIGNGSGLREILRQSLPETFPDPELPQNTENGCKFNDDLFYGQQNIVGFFIHK
uniref:Uncharacterized protein n=1 Tax=Panagrolaimus sp. ES5 TaxID=591445 RepID=A0AC34FCT8_9BILA